MNSNIWSDNIHYIFDNNLKTHSDPSIKSICNTCNVFKTMYYNETYIVGQKE